MSKTSVVIVAAGSGKRSKLTENKVFFKINGIPVLIKTIKKFEQLSQVDEILVVCKKEEIKLCENLIFEEFKIKKVKKIVSGGKERQDSVFEGLKNISTNSEIVLIHDAARPFIKEEHIIESIKIADEKGACCLGVKVKDTIKEVVDNFVKTTLNREYLWQVQTPQTFQKDLILKAYENLKSKNIKFTDDSSLIEKMGKEVYMLEGDYFNIKITTPEDLLIAEIFDKNKA